MEQSSKIRVSGSLFWTYAILVLHVALMLLVAVAIVFFRGIYEYFGWILGGGLALLALSALLVVRRLKRDRRRLRDMLDSPLLKGRSVEVSLLGGMASLRLGRQNGAANVLDEERPTLIESSEAQRAETLAGLGRMLEKDQISREEFERLKRELVR